MPFFEQGETSSPIVRDHVFVALANPVFESRFLCRGIVCARRPDLHITVSFPPCREMYLHILTSQINAEGR